MKAFVADEQVRCRAHRGVVWRQRCALDAVHVLDGGRAHWAGDEIWWPIADSERMTEREQKIYDWLTDSPSISHEGALLHIAMLRDVAWMRNHAATMALYTSLMLLAAMLILYVTR